MLFNSPLFLFFFAAVAAVFYAAPPRGRWLVLLAASALFYASWDYRYLAVILADGAVAYAYGRWQRFLRGGAARWGLAAAIALILSPLAYFKYANFLLGNLHPLLAVLGWPAPGSIPGLILPLGISFYTFQLISYCVDVHLGRCAPAESLPRLWLYPMYFPHQIAGPIVRPAQLLPQFRSIANPRYEQLASGFRVFLWGLFKKVFVADRLAVFADAVFAHPGDHGGLATWLAVYFFAFQIYCDFSGYSDMAIGASRLLGVELCENFRRPYFAASLREFWTRWHISLSQWIRDYLYIPLGGNHVGPRRWAFNILAAFTLSGLWHGASWTFVLWGFYHGVLLLIERALGRLVPARLAAAARGPWARLLGIALTFHLACLGWILFRSPSLAAAGSILAGLAAAPAHPLTDILPAAQLALAFAGIALVVAIDFLAERGALDAFARSPLALRWAAYQLAILLVLLFPGTNEIKTFIYFQF